MCSKIKNQRLKLEGKILELSDKLKVLKQECQHNQADVQAYSDTGHYWEADDRWWVEVKCPDCGSYKEFDSVDDKVEYTKWLRIKSN